MTVTELGPLCIKLEIISLPLVPQSCSCLLKFGHFFPMLFVGSVPFGPCSVRFRYGSRMAQFEWCQFSVGRFLCISAHHKQGTVPVPAVLVLPSVLGRPSGFWSNRFGSWAILGEAHDTALHYGVVDRLD